MKNDYLKKNTDNIYYPIVLMNRNDIRIPIEAKFLYGVLFDKLCQGNADQDGRRFVVCDFEEIKRKTRSSAKEIDDYLIILEAADLIERMEAPESLYLKACPA